MALSNPRTQFGIYSVSFIDRTNHIPYGIVKVLGDFTLSGDTEKKDLYGGANRIPWDSEFGNITADASFTVKEMSPVLFQLAGFTKTVTSSDADGSVAIENVKGTSVSNANGISGVALTNADSGDLKDGVYYVQAASSTTVDIFMNTELFATRGNDLTIAADTLKITSSAIDKTATTPWDHLGITPTWAGSPSLVSGDVAKITVYAPHSGIYDYAYTSTATPVECEAYVYGQMKSDGSYVMIHLPRVTISNVPVTIKEKDWFSADIKFGIKYDSTAGYSFKIHDVLHIA
jgi:hypothetical protein